MDTPRHPRIKAPVVLRPVDLEATVHSEILALTVQVQQLTVALHSRETIAVAVGLLMYRYRLDKGAAFNVLRRLSSHGQRKLRDVAQEMVNEFNDTGLIS
jgi:AmiR/NasT family two-component response regulator